MTLTAAERIAVHRSGAKRAERIVIRTFFQPQVEIDRDRDPNESGVESKHRGFFVGLRPEREGLFSVQRSPSTSCRSSLHAGADGNAFTAFAANECLNRTPTGEGVQSTTVRPGRAADRICSRDLAEHVLNLGDRNGANKGLALVADDVRTLLTDPNDEAATTISFTTPHHSRGPKPYWRNGHGLRPRRKRPLCAAQPRAAHVHQPGQALSQCTLYRGDLGL